MYDTRSQVKELLKNRINSKKAIVGVIGLGYVGLPLAMELVSAGYHVVGIDIDGYKVARLNEGYSHILDVTDKQVTEATRNGFFQAVDDFSVIENLDAVSVCVPTPLNENQSTPPFTRPLLEQSGIWTKKSFVFYKIELFGCFFSCILF
ncbi:nucleotide sugar dehydrogenase [Listeria fleischmannii subsp. coloradonensis]|uniref:NAD(P)-binding domain-containing protein n=1 Tax=Listeria fleischmannii TaxID=1069827 RepID=UPI000254F7A7|nr:NAD(P)-binding domain-containing protein [Listeria fleischmannii]EIA19361.1 nucleotide sugar dehydrogenase [Listeria fleischmannii subsp. coloradonensis]